MNKRHALLGLSIGLVGFIFGFATSSVSCLAPKQASADGGPSQSAYNPNPSPSKEGEDLGRSLIVLSPCSKYIEHSVGGKGEILLKTRSLRRGEVPEDTRVEAISELYTYINLVPETKILRKTVLLFREHCP